MKTTFQTRLGLARDIYFSPPTDDGCILLNLERGTILSLNGSAAFVLSRLAKNAPGITRHQLVESVAAEFEDVEVKRVGTLVDDLLARLEKVGALHTDHAGGAPKKFDLRTRLARRLPICVRYLLIPLLFMRAYTFAALILLLTIECVRSLGGFRSIHQTIERWTLGQMRATEDLTIANACAAVNRACTWHPKRALCLQRAGALVCLLRSLGLPAELVIGVHTMPFYGHAWAELEGRVVNDHANAQKFFQVLSRC